VETGEPARHRFHFSRAGFEAWVDLTVVKLGDGYAATFRDVSAQVATENALRNSETRFRLLVEGVRDYAIFLLDAEGRVISWNAGAERLKGYTADEIIGQHVSRLYPPVAMESANQELRIAEQEGRSESEGWHLRGDGGGFWAHSIVTALRDETGLLTGFARLTRDVSERRAAEQAIRASEQRFRSLFTSTPIGVAVIAPDGRLTDANPALCTLLGRDAEALRGAKLMELTHPGDRRLLAPLFADLLGRKSASFHIEGRFVRADGGVVWAQTTASVVADPDGEPLYVVASVADVTERRRLEEAAIEAAETERRRLSYELHDDLAQRLAGASVLSHTLGEHLREDDHPGAATAVRLGDLVRDAMAHARALSRALAPVDLLSEGLAEALGRLCNSTEQAYGVTCRFEASMDTQVADPSMATHLFRIAQEAVSNAGRHARAKEICVSLEGGPGGLRLTISDDGIGLPHAAVGTTSGLGLRTMRARAAALGGTLVLDGSERGTTVRVVVPLRSRQDD
jgi:PAS domain S-box-containing protein